ARPLPSTSLAPNESQPLLATIDAVTASIVTSPTTVASDSDRSEHDHDHGRPDQRANDEIARWVSEQGLRLCATGQAPHRIDHVRDRLVSREGAEPAGHRRHGHIGTRHERERNKEEGDALCRLRVACVEPRRDPHPLEGEAEHDDEGEGDHSIDAPAMEAAGGEKAW